MVLRVIQLPVNSVSQTSTYRDGGAYCPEGGCGGGAENERRRREFVGGLGASPLPENFEI